VRVVLDTNVLVSALHFGGRPRRLLDDVLRGDHTLIIGPAILGELEAVLVDTCGWTRDRAAAVRAELEAIAEVVTPVDVPRVCRDPDDDQILAIAVSGAADALVTGDAIYSQLACKASLASSPSPASRRWGITKVADHAFGYPRDVHAIPTDSIKRALVIIPTISRRKHSKPNSARRGK
jgi:putative PIN family toxin of toxin-antitoxin system